MLCCHLLMVLSSFEGHFPEGMGELLSSMLSFMYGVVGLSGITVLNRV